MNLTSLNYKKIGLVVGFVILAVIIAYFIFTIFFKPTSPINQIPEEQSPSLGEGLPEAGSGTQTPIDQSGGALPDSGTIGGNIEQRPGVAVVEDLSADLAISAANPNISSNGQMRFYNENDGKFYRLDENGKAVLLADKRFAGADNVTWSPTSNKAVIEFPDGSKVRYNFDTKEQITLPKHWEDFAFSPSGDKLVSKSIGVDPNNRWLIISNDDGSQARQIEELGENGDDVISSWSPNNQTIAMYSESIDFNRKEIYFIGQNGENFKSIVTVGPGFQPQWSPSGSELLYSVYSDTTDYKPTLWLTSAQGDSIGANRRPLEINTWADKCTFGGSSLYCAVPQSLERGSGLFPSLADSTPDFLYKINPSTGTKEPISLGSGSYTMKNLNISADGSYLYFTDTATQRLRRIKLR